VTEDEFIALLDELGGEAEGWPAHLREGAIALLAHSARARAALKAMRDVEGFLAQSTPALSIDCAAIATRASRPGQPGPSIMSPALRKVSFAALGVAALAAGIMVGMTPPSGSAIVGSVQMALNGGTGDVW
jgi:hypothetical protein